MSQKPALLLFPNLLGEHRHVDIFLPQSVAKAIQTIDGLIAESASEGRRYLDRFETKKPSLEIPIALFNEHTPDDHLDFLLEPMTQGERWGLVSDAGLPCIADPGSKIVHKARQKGITVQAFVGPSSMLLALMLSGFPGQKFYFHGYLSRDQKVRETEIKRMAQNSQKEQSTQIFMETPYRNQYSLQACIESLPDQVWLCVAWDLTLPTQGVVSQTIASWKKCTLPNLDKKPAIFLIHYPTE